MDNLTLLAPMPKDLDRPFLVTAFAGWADAQEGASRAIRYILRRAGAVKFARIDPEPFYDFTQSRPVVYLDETNERKVRWPANEFYYVRSERARRDMLLFLGVEPGLKWRAFTSAMLDVVRICDAQGVLTLGALLDAVPHTRDPRVTGSALNGPLRERFMELGFRGSGYQGPTGIPTALMERCAEAQVPYCSLWGHAPHYLQVAPNPRVTRAILSALMRVLDIDVDLTDLESREAVFDREVEKVVEENPEVRAYVERLEQHYDASTPTPPPTPLPSAESVVRDLEAYLRLQGRQSSPEDEGDDDDGGRWDV